MIKDGNIVVGKYVINKVNLGSGAILSLGDDKQRIVSLIDEPTRIHRNIRNEVPEIIYSENIVACYHYDKLEIGLTINKFDLLDSIIIRNPAISYMGFKIGDSVKLDKPYINLVRVQPDLVFVKWEYAIKASVVDSYPYKFVDTKPVIYFFWKVKKLQENLAQIEEIIIQFPGIVKMYDFRKNESEDEGELVKWCRIIMKNYPK